VHSAGIRIRSHSKRATADPRLRSFGYWDRPKIQILNTMPKLSTVLCSDCTSGKEEQCKINEELATTLNYMARNEVRWKTRQGGCLCKIYSIYQHLQQTARLWHPSTFIKNTDIYFKNSEIWPFTFRTWDDMTRLTTLAPWIRYQCMKAVTVPVTLSDITHSNNRNKLCLQYNIKIFHRMN
jgi:hypothetical protein